MSIGIVPEEPLQKLEFQLLLPSNKLMALITLQLFSDILPSY